MNKEEADIFRQQRIASPEGQAVIESLSRQPDHLAHEYNMDDGTAGHSKGNWHYYGDIHAGIKTTCQHLYTPEEREPLDKDGVWIVPNHQHEDDDIIPEITEETHYANPDQTTTWEDYLANLRLMALAQQAPHDCGDPECPGVQNKRKLELYDKFQAAINAFNEQGLLT